MHNDLVDPAEMMRRGFHLWAQTRWPGRNARVHYAHTLFNLYLIRQLALLSMRVWDADESDAGERLGRIQAVLDELWKTRAPDQPVLVRDARWLIPLAMSPATDDLAPYFEAAQRISETFAENDRLEIQRILVLTAGGHLRSYLHYYVTQKGVPLDDGRHLLITRKSNALDYSLLIQGLVPLLEAYESAMRSGDERKRLELADAIGQGVSPDPELFVNRVAVLGAYSMVEHLFTTTDREGHATYTPMGRRHVRLLEDYEARIARLAKPLHDDVRRLGPVDGGYSPFGVLYGFSSNLLEHIALKTLTPDADARFGLEDVFSAGDAGKLAWVNGWRNLPHVGEEVRKLYAYPQRFAEQIFERLDSALSRRSSGGDASAVGRTGRVRVGPALERARAAGDAARDLVEASAIAELPLRYVVSTDAEVVAAGKAEACDEKTLQSGRLEGHFVLSYETSGGATAVSKDFLTEILAAGHDVKIAGLPPAAAATLRLMCRDLVSG